MEIAGRDRACRRRHLPRAVLEGRSRGRQGEAVADRRSRSRNRTAMTPPEAVARLNTVLAHAWMVRTFLKHADEIQDNEDMLDVPRVLYDSIRAVEPAFQRGDTTEYLRRLKGKLPKLRKAAEYFNVHF